MKIILIVLGVVIALVGVFCMGGCGHHRSIEGKADWIANKIRKELDLDEGQNAKLLALKDQVVSDFRAEKANREKTFDTILTQIESDKLDQKVIKNLIEEKHARMQSKSEAWIGKAAEFHASLRPEQKKELANHLREFRDKMSRHFE